MSDAFDRFSLVLRFAGEHKLTDVLFKAGTRPFYRRAGQLISRPQEQAFTQEDLASIAERVMNGEQMGRFNKGSEVTAVLPVVGVGRFRVHVFRQRATIGLSVRVHPGRARTAREIGLPAGATALCGRHAGLVVISSAAGGGRTTTLTAMAELLNAASPARRIVTIGAAIEIALTDKSAWTCQRAIGTDAPAWDAAVRGAIAQGCDVLALDDVPDLDTLLAAIDAAERGVLVLMAVANRDIGAAMRRLMALVPADRAASLRQRLVGVLGGGVESTLVPTIDGGKQVPAFGVWVIEPRAYQLLRDGHDPAAIYDIMHSRASAMQTSDQHLAELYAAGTISGEAAMAMAVRPQALARR